MQPDLDVIIPFEDKEFLPTPLQGLANIRRGVLTEAQQERVRLTAPLAQSSHTDAIGEQALRLTLLTVLCNNPEQMLRMLLEYGARLPGTVT